MAGFKFPTKSPYTFVPETINEQQKIMKRIVFSMVVLLVPAIQAVAQTGNGTVVGMLEEKTSGIPVEFATIAFHEAATGQMVTGCMTDSAGLFRMEKLKEGKYYVEGSFVGFKPVKTDVFIVGKGTVKDLGILYIKEGEQLQEVVVEGRRPTFTAKLDRKVFRVGQDVMATSGSAADVMQNIPSVEVDMDGTVSLRGNENVTILIDGKPSAMMSAKMRGDALNQLGASSIERIEVITNPSAEYKPDGVSGVINIVLKKDAMEGLNGVLSGNVGSYGRNNAGVNLNYGLKRLNLFGGYTFRRDRYDHTINDHRTSPTDIINQTTYGLGRPVSHTIRLGMNANLTGHDVVEMAGSYNRRRFQRNEWVESETTDMKGTLTDSYRRDRDALANENLWEGTLRYNHTYGKGNEWGMDYTYSSETEDEMNHYATRNLQGDEKDNEAV